MKVLLRETINSLGIIGTEVVVADGYARNYLLPKGKAVLVTDKNINRFKQEKARFELQIAKEKNIAEQMAEKIDGIKCQIPSKVNGETRLYGSVGVKDIVRVLSKEGIDVDKRMVDLKEPIKSVGLFKVPINIYNGVSPTIVVEVIAE